MPAASLPFCHVHDLPTTNTLWVPVQAALLRWWQLPEVGWTPQIPLLQTFQQLVEVRESMKVSFIVLSGLNRCRRTHRAALLHRC